METQKMPEIPMVMGLKIMKMTMTMAMVFLPRTRT
jgi:hypothetical protein